MTDPRTIAAAFQAATQQHFMPEYRVLSYKTVDGGVRVTYTAPVWRGEVQRAIVAVKSWDDDAEVHEARREGQVDQRMIAFTVSRASGKLLSVEED